MRVWLLTILLLMPTVAATSIAESDYTMPLKLKTGVKPLNVVPEMLLANQVVCSFFDHHQHDCIITSMHDGVHGPRSLHSRDGLCRAIDYRTKHLNDVTKQFIVQGIKEALGDQYDVILESLGQSNEHLHVELSNLLVKPTVDV